MIEQKIMTVKDVQEFLKIGRTKAYSLVHQGIFPIIKIGNDIRILKEDFENWLVKEKNSPIIETVREESLNAK